METIPKSSKKILKSTLNAFINIEQRTGLTENTRFVFEDIEDYLSGMYSITPNTNLLIRTALNAFHELDSLGRVNHKEEGVMLELKNYLET